jgi:hypothetical protein
MIKNHTDLRRRMVVVSLPPMRRRFNGARMGTGNQLPDGRGISRM